MSRWEFTGIDMVQQDLIAHLSVPQGASNEYPGSNWIFRPRLLRLMQQCSSKGFRLICNVASTWSESEITFSNEPIESQRPTRFSNFTWEPRVFATYHLVVVLVLVAYTKDALEACLLTIDAGGGALTP